MPTLNVKLQANGQDLWAGYIRVGEARYDQDTPEKAGHQLLVDEAGTVAMEYLPPGRYFVWPFAAGYTGEMLPVELVDGENPQVVIAMMATVAVIPPVGSGQSANQAGKLQSSGPIFRVNGQAWRWIGVTAFALPQRHAEGEDIDRFLAWAIGTGFVVLRCLFGHANIARQMGKAPFLATPAQTEAFLQKLASRQVRCEWSVGDFQELLADLADQHRWYDAQAEVLSQFELVTAETCNEPFKNGVDVAAIGRLGRGIVQASGNYAPPCAPVLDYGTTHTPRDEEWPRKGKELYDLYTGFDGFPGGARVPWLSDEGMGADETNQPGKRSNVPNDFFDDAAVCALMGAGLTHHGTDLVYAKIPGPTQQACAAAAVAAASSIGPEAPLGAYTRGLLSDCPLEHDDTTALRTFARINGGRAEAIVVRPTTTERVARNGWRIVSTSGPDNRVVVLER